MLSAQVLQRRAIKCDLIAFGRNGLQLGYEYRQKPNASFEFQFGFERHLPPEGVEVFHGDWLKYYAQDKTDTLVKSTLSTVGSSGWQYFDEERPLPEVPTFTPHSTFQAAGLYRISFQNGERPWKLFLQSGLLLTLHRYFESRDALHIEQRATESWDYINAQGQARTVRYYLTLYEEQRSIRLKNNWRAGVAYQLGLSRRLGKHLFVEGRIDLGLHIGPPPYESPEPPRIAQRLPVKGALLVGWAF